MGLNLMSVSVHTGVSNTVSDPMQIMQSVWLTEVASTEKPFSSPKNAENHQKVLSYLQSNRGVLLKQLECLSVTMVSVLEIKVLCGCDKSGAVPRNDEGKKGIFMLR